MGTQPRNSARRLAGTHYVRQSQRFASFVVGAIPLATSLLLIPGCGQRPGAGHAPSLEPQPYLDGAVEIALDAIISEPTRLEQDHETGDLFVIGLRTAAPFGPAVFRVDLTGAVQAVVSFPPTSGLTFVLPLAQSDDILVGEYASPDGGLAVGRMVRVSPDGLADTLVEDDAFGAPMYAVQDPDTGDLWVYGYIWSAEDGRLLRVTESGEISLIASGLSTGWCWKMVVDPNGDGLVAVYSDGLARLAFDGNVTPFEFETATGRLDDIADDPQSDDILAVASSTDFETADSATATLMRIADDGTVTTISSGQMYYPLVTGESATGDYLLAARDLSGNMRLFRVAPSQ